VLLIFRLEVPVLKGILAFIKLLEIIPSLSQKFYAG
jgi:hypothetical protein